MTADPRMFNGSSLTFNSTPVAKLIGMQYRENGTVIDVTEPADLTRIVEVGQPDLELSCSVKRLSELSVGDTGTLAATWHDGSTTSLTGTWIVTSVSGGGQQDSAITGEVTFKPSVATA